MNKNTMVYLKPNVVTEPLIKGWYAWTHLISPATAAMNIVHRCINIMDSYIESPELHSEAVKDIQMLGGPFMDYATDRSKDILNLRDSTLQLTDIMKFAEGIKKLADLLEEQARGFSIEGLYSKVPEELKGYVELIYDLNNHPSFRFYEALLYNSPYYDESIQSFFLYLTDKDDRTFILSTPRLEEEDGTHLKLPFKHKALDELFKMQRQSQSFGYICDLLQLDEKQEELFSGFFTTEAPQPYARYNGDKMRTRYFGHACILLETKKISILSDPVISYGYDTDISRLTYSDLPDEIDYVVITHNHQDHILLETMIKLRHKIKTIVVPRNGNGELQDPNLKLMFNNIGFKNVIEIDEFEKIVEDDFCITGLPFLGEHCDLNIRTKMCYHVKFEDFSVLLAADCCNIEPKIFSHVHKLVGDIDVLFLGMECDGAPLTWLYGPLMNKRISRDQDFSRRLTGSNYDRGMDLVNRFNPSEVYVYAMGLEPWLKYIMSLNHTDESYPIVESNKLIKECQSREIISERLFGEKELSYKLSYAEYQVE